MGTLFFNGVYPDQIVQCTLGTYCWFNLVVLNPDFATNGISFLGRDATDVCGASSNFFVWNLTVGDVSFATPSEFLNSFHSGSSTSDLPAVVSTHQLGISTVPLFGLSYSDTTERFDIGTMRTGLPGSFKICWGHDPASSLFSYSYNYYPVRGGSLVLTGPFPVATTYCTVGTYCSLHVYGVGLNAATNRIRLLSSTEVCHQSSTVTDVSGFVNTDGAGGILGVASSTTGFANAPITASHYSPISGTSADTVSLVMYNFGISDELAATTRKVCWTSDTASVSADPLEFAYSEFGILSVTRPTMMPVSCMVGEFCNVTLTGLNLVPSNRLIIISENTCGQADSEYVMYSGIGQPISPVPNPTAILTQGDDPTAPSYGLYMFGISTERKNSVGYTVCWASDPFTNLTRGNSIDPRQYNVPIGRFNMFGTDPSNGSCILGQQCAITLTGTGFATTNRVLLIREYSNDVRSRAETRDPREVVPKTDAIDPQRNMERIDRELPIKVRETTLRDAPNEPPEKVENDDPAKHALLRDKLLPIKVLDRTDRELPNAILQIADSDEPNLA